MWAESWEEAKTQVWTSVQSEWLQEAPSMLSIESGTSRGEGNKDYA